MSTPKAPWLNAADYTGGNAAAQINAAVTALGANVGVVLVPPDLGAGAPTAPPANVAILDLRTAGTLALIGGALQVGPGAGAIDTSSAGTLGIGTTNATSISIGKASVAVDHPGGLTIGAGKNIESSGAINIGPALATAVVIGSSTLAPSFPGGLTIAAAKAIDTTAAGALNIGPTTATSIVIGKAGVVPSFPGGLTIAAATTIDTTAAGAMNIGTTNANAMLIGGAGFTVFFAGPIIANSGTFNSAQLTGSTTGNPVVLSAIGNDTNISLRLTPKGTGVVDLNYAAVALGGGAAPTFGTIGGSGPATAAQNSWVKINVAGVATYIPGWR